MFFSYVVRDIVEIEPVYFPASLAQASDRTARNESKAVTTSALSSSAPYTLSLEEIVQHRLTEMYVGKVLPGQGLCVALIDVLSYTDSEIKGPSGAAWLTATFSLCVFAPRPGARLRASIVDQDATGLYLTLDFFSAFPFLVPAAELIPGSVFDKIAKKWCMPVEVEEIGSAAPLVNYYEFDEDVIVKVVRCLVRLEAEVRASEEEGRPVPLMELVGSFIGDGLGPVAWFEGEEEDDGENDENGKTEEGAGEALLSAKKE